jgi:Holliday junction resolvase RusA-like endonuclease
MDIYHFAIDPPTSTHQSALRIIRKKNGASFVGKYTKSDVKKWENAFKLLLKAKKPKNTYKSGTPVRLVFGLFYKAPQSRPCPTVQWKTTKPDADNVVKVMMDALVSEGYIETDQQVAELRIMKLEWEQGGFVEIMISEAEPWGEVPKR